MNDKWGGDNPLLQEIGSEFWDVPIAKGKSYSLFPQNTCFFLSGRSALSFIIKDVKQTKPLSSVALPSYCCESMVKPFLNHGVAVETYPVVFDERGGLRAVFPKSINSEAILVMDYFGYYRQIVLPEYKGVIIRDVTHSLFCGIPNDADYTFGSLRKWAGLWTGGYAWRRDGSFEEPLPLETKQGYVELRQQAMREKYDYINGVRFDKHHKSVFEQAEKLLEEDDWGAADTRDVECAMNLDVEFIKERRRNNAEILLKGISDIALFPSLQGSDCPLFVPIRVRGGRNRLQRYLIDQEIYCPIHWPIPQTLSLTEDTKTPYDEELSVICDQRYDAADMERICAAISKFYEREKLS